MHINPKYIQKAIRDTVEGNELLDYLHSQDYNPMTDDWRSIEVDLTVFPVKYAELIAQAIKETILQKYPISNMVNTETDEEFIETLSEESKINQNDNELQGLRVEYMELWREINASRKAISKNGKVQTIQKLSFALGKIFREKLGERPWLYSLSFGRYEPWLVRTVHFSPKNKSNSNAYIYIVLAKNDKNRLITKNVYINRDDLLEFEKNPYEILKGKNLFFETEEMYEAYQKGLKEYSNKAIMQGKQFLCKDDIRYINDNLHLRNGGEDGCEDSEHGKENSNSVTERLVSDFAKKGRTDINDKDRLAPVPHGFSIYLFNLSSHKFEWKNALDLSHYLYNGDIVKELVLPKKNKELIDILLTDINSFKDMSGDLIKGKGNGTIILAKGDAGTGKTSTAEVYSELKKLPLYSVHSGQLGIDGFTIEKNLRTILSRAERWNSVLLIDECDVYLRSRDNNENHNAIVASFLRTIEYYNGLMFMTSNIEDIDESVESRCTAIIRYKKPDSDMCLELWSIYSKRYNLNLNDEVMKMIDSASPYISGRDIKNICMLCSRYMTVKGVDSCDFDTIILCASFRGIEIRKPKS